MRRILIIMLLCLSVNVFSQNGTQTIRGVITDLDTKSPLIGVNVVVQGASEIIAAVTDMNGKYRLEDVPVGRVTINYSYVGYKDRLVSNVPLNSGKELILNIEMEESVTNLEEVVVRAHEKDESINEMAVVSARQFTVEETGRYAGSRNDVSRMAANFAGVTNGDDSRNDIVIRGNSPNGILWRLNDLDIPDPNHFSGMGSSGGPVSMLNYNVLSNSDFMTAAFPSEYSNALSGVFDIKMRNGNNEKREYMFQFGSLGTELMLEGPFNKNYNGSYLINYRFSTTSIMDAMNIDFGYDGKADYQDLAFNFDLPLKNGDKVNIFGMWGNSVYKLLNKDKSEDSFDVEFVPNSDQYYKNNAKAIGASYFNRLSSNAYWKTTVGITGEDEIGEIDSVSTEDFEAIEYYRTNNNYNNVNVNSFVKYRLNSKNKVKIGVNLKNIAYDVKEEFYNQQSNTLRPYRTSSGNTWLTQGFVQWKYIPFDRLQFNAGVNAQQLRLNNTMAIEPRLGVRYNLAVGQSVNLGYGKHSQTQQLQMYFVDTEIGDQIIHTNKQLELSKSDHFVLGYQARLFKNMNLKTEAYYQYLYDIPVHGSDNPTSFSLINQGANYEVADEDSLVNDGLGRNYGLELTLEKFFSKGYYYLITASVYESKYRASDLEWRNTAFNGNYVLNTLVGKEFNINKNSKIMLDLKLTFAGGRRYTPVDKEKSIEKGEVVEIDEEAYSLQHDPYFRTDFKITYRVNRPKVAHEIFLNVDNVFNTKNVFTYSYNIKKQDFQYVYQLGLFPTLQYKIYF